MINEIVRRDKPVEVLIAEDSPTQAEYLKYLLEKHDFTVYSASNGRESLNILRRCRPDVIISDIIMPEMDGYEFCKRIKTDESLKTIPVILLTALADPRDVMSGLECGADNFITKPYTEEYLLARIQYLLANQHLQKSNLVQMGIEVFFSGRKYFITSDRLQILNLLLSTYETAVQKNSELERVQEDLRMINESLEERVKARTEALETEITERKQAQIALTESEQKYKSLVNNVKSGIFRCTLTPRGRFLEINKAMEIITGYNRAELLSMDVSNLYVDPNSRGDFVQQVCDSGKTISRELNFRRKDQGEIIVLATTTAIRDNDGTLLYIDGILEDISERKQAATKALEMETLRHLNLAKSELLANVSHELRTPLSAIKGFIETLLETDVSWTDIQRLEFLSAADKETDRLNMLIKDLLDVSRIESGRLSLDQKVCHLEAVLEAAKNTLQALTVRHTLVVRLPPDIPSVKMDQMRIVQVITNLVENAVKFSPEGSPITIEAAVNQSELTISVIDRGVGIPPEAVDQLFNRFYQAHKVVSGSTRGTGLGLSICKGIVEAHGGRIWVNSQVDQGSVFTFTLPVVPAGS